MRLLLAVIAFIITSVLVPLTGLALPETPEPVTDADFYENGAPSEAKVELGRMLFFDKVLSGNRNISCATCHHPDHASGDAVALGFGEGAQGLGGDRRPGTTLAETIHERVPRNAPALFNVGTHEHERLFHDGRVETDEKGYYEGGFITPAKWKLPGGLDNVLAAQAMFPVTSPIEMAGQKGENEIADAKSLNNAAGPGGVWDLLGKRLQAIPEYVELFRRAFPDKVETKSDITYVLAANAIAAFETVAFRADRSPFDLYLRGEGELSPRARAGMDLFYGKAGCGDCHTGKFQTDHEFHGIAMPQIGPGKGDGRDGTYWRATGVQAFVEDFGRGRVTVRQEDNYRFRTPSLRNVELTGPWGHDGAYATLEDVVRHHLDPVRSLERYELPKGLLPPIDRVAELTATGDTIEHEFLSATRFQGFLKRDTWVQGNEKLRAKIADANELDPVELTDAEVEALIAFLKSLTDPRSRDLRSQVPARVPSGLPVEDEE